MANSSYCRFQNTANDLRDCLSRFDDKLSPDESEAREDIIRLCHTILGYVGGTDIDRKALNELIKHYTESAQMSED